MSFASTRNGNRELFSDDEFSGDEEDNEENNEELGLDRKHDVEKCYQNYLEAVAPDSRRENRPTLPSRADIDFNDMDEYEDDGDIYEELDEDAMVTMARHPPTMSSSAHGSSSASASAASSSVFRRTSSSSAASSFASEDDDCNGNNNNNSSNRNTGRRQSNGQAPSVSGGGGGRAVSGSGVRRQSATSVGGGGGGVVIEDGLNTAKIVNIKSNLRPVASKIFDTVNNREEDNVVGGSTGWPRSTAPAASVPRPMNNGGRDGGGAPVGCAKKSVGSAEVVTPQKKRPAVKAVSVESTSDVGTGQNSIRIKAQMARLRPVLSRNDCDDNIDEQDPPVRDVQKILPIGPAAKKKTSASSASNANRWNQQIQNSPSPPPPPFPSPPPSPPPPAFPLSSPKKTPAFGPTATKTPSSSHRTQAWHQSTNSPPSLSPASSSSSPFPDPPPVSNGRRELSHTPKQTGQKQDQPWGRAPWSNDPSETPAVKRNAERTQSQQPAPATKASHALAATHPGLGRSGSVNPSSNGYDSSLLTNQNYYFGDLERDQCEKKLDRLINEDGSYLVRNSRGGGPDSPYSLSIVYSRHVYHLNIRLRPDGKFSIGKAKSDEKMFNSVAEMISFHQNNAIELIGDNQKRTPSGKVTLKKCPNKF